MLGVVTNPTMTPSDEVMQQVAEEMGVGRHVRHDAGRGVLRRRPPGARRRGRRPVLRRRRARRRGCIECGECMTGCRHGAKNTLVKNYLYLAEQAGAEVHPDTTVDCGSARSTGGGYAVDTVRTGAWFAGRATRHRSPPTRWCSPPAPGARRSCCTACGPTGRCPRSRPARRADPHQLRGARRRHHAMRGRRRHDFTRGVAITSSFHPDATPTSSRSATARAATPWGCWPR